MLDSFIMTQKNSIAKDIRKKFSKYLWVLNNEIKIKKELDLTKWDKQNMIDDTFIFSFIFN